MHDVGLAHETPFSMSAELPLGIGTTWLDHDEPLQRSAVAHAFPPFEIHIPTASQAVARQEIPSSWANVDPLGAGADIPDQPDFVRVSTMGAMLPSAS